jgi:hypothetical protein
VLYITSCYLSVKSVSEKWRLSKKCNPVLNQADNSLSGFMDFKGRRGVTALDSPVRNIDLPHSSDEPVVNLIIGKAVLATGCTAISLTKESTRKYMPRRIIIASCFYSKKGVSELMHEIPNADLILVGEADKINNDGMLEPGIGNLDQRLHADCKCITII